MKKSKLIKRIILFLIIGALTFIFLDMVFNWEESKASFKEGYNHAIKQRTEKRINE